MKNDNQGLHAFFQLSHGCRSRVLKGGKKSLGVNFIGKYTFFFFYTYLTVVAVTVQNNILHRPTGKYEECCSNI